MELIAHYCSSSPIHSHNKQAWKLMIFNKGRARFQNFACGPFSGHDFVKSIYMYNVCIFVLYHVRTFFTNISYETPLD